MTCLAQVGLKKPPESPDGTPTPVGHVTSSFMDEQQRACLHFVLLVLQALRDAIAGLYNNISSDQLVVCAPEEGGLSELHMVTSSIVTSAAERPHLPAALY